MLDHVIEPPGGPLAGVQRARPEDDGGGARGVGVRAIVDDVTGTCQQPVGADVTHAAEIQAVAEVLHARRVVRLIGPQCQAQLRNSVIQRLHTHTHMHARTPIASSRHGKIKKTLTYVIL